MCVKVHPSTQLLSCETTRKLSTDPRTGLARGGVTPSSVRSLGLPSSLTWKKTSLHLQAERLIPTQRPVQPLTSTGTDLGWEPRKLFSVPDSWSQAGEQPPRPRGGAEREGRPAALRPAPGAPRSGNAHPRNGAEGARYPPRGLAGCSAAERERPSRRQGRAGRHDNEALPRAEPGPAGKRAPSPAPVIPSSHERGAPE